MKKIRYALRYAALMLCILMLLGAAACESPAGQQADSDAAGTKVPATEEATEAPAETEAPVVTEAPIETAAPVEETAPEFIPLEKLTVNSALMSPEEQIGTYHIENFYVHDPEGDGMGGEIGNELSMHGFYNTWEMQEAYDKLLYGDNDPATTEPAAWMYHDLYCRVFARRSDDRVISILYTVDIEDGETNDIHYVKSLNLSSKESRELEAEDFIKDTEAFIEAVNAELAKAGVSRGITAEDMDDLVLTLDHFGVTVFFNGISGRLAGIASACPNVMVKYSGNEGIFAEEYLPEGTIHTGSFPLGLPYRTAIGGEEAGITVEHELDRYGVEWTDNIIISLNGREFTFEAPTIGDEAVFMHTENGDYIYIEATDFASGRDEQPYVTYPLIYVFGIEGGEVVSRGCFSGSLRQWPLEAVDENSTAVYSVAPVDPNALELIETGELPFGFSGWRTCAVGADGMPAAVDPVYRIDGENLFLLKKGFTADLINEAGEVDGSVELTPQLALMYLGTDGNSYCDMHVMELDVDVRLYIEDGGAVIDGIPADELWIFVTDDVALG